MADGMDEDGARAVDSMGSGGEDRARSAKLIIFPFSFYTVL